MSINSINNKIINININQKNINNNKIKKINNTIKNINKKLNSNISLIRNINLNKKDLYKKIGVLDPDGTELNPLTNEPYKNIYYNPNKEFSKSNFTYSSLAKMWSNLPMYAKTEEALDVIYNNQVILIISGTGSGKTVLTPKYVLHCLNYQGKIAITNPKKIPSSGNAEFSAKMFDVKLGEEVGVKFKGSNPDYYSKEKSKLVYCTDGHILNKLYSDPLLSDYDSVIIDEAHERGVNIDLLLLLLRKLLLKRPKFKLIIMSATINEKMFIDYFPKDKYKFGFLDAGSKPNYPVTSYFLDKPINKMKDKQLISKDEDFLIPTVDRIIKIMNDDSEGDILVFISGKGEGAKGCSLLSKKLIEYNKNKSREEKIYCDILSGATDKITEKKLISEENYKEGNKYNRKVIFATEVAESSVTIDGIKYVIDTGLANINIYYSDTDIEALEKRYISKASHRQRMGRTGRTGPGFCYNMFTEKEYENDFQDFAISPIYLENISDFILKFLDNKELVSHIDYPFNYNIKDNSNNFKAKSLALVLKELIEPPNEKDVINTLNKLYFLDGININNNIGYISDIGRGMAKFGILPELGRMLIAGYNYKCKEEIIIFAAILEILEFRIENIFREPKKKSDIDLYKKELKEFDKIKKKFSKKDGDALTLINIYKEYKIRRFGITNRKTRNIIKNKNENYKEWCNKHFLNEKKLDKISREISEISKNFSHLIRIQKNKFPNNKPEFLFINSPREIKETKEENILQAILIGFVTNIVNKDGNKYFTCFPNKITSSKISQNSFLNNIKTSYTYYVYTQYKSIFGNDSLNIMTRGTPYFKEFLKEKYKEKYEKILNCNNKIKKIKNKIKSKSKSKFTKKKSRLTIKKKKSIRKKRYK